MDNKEINLEADFEKFLHPRITEYCLPIFRGGHFKSAALEAFAQVEEALKEKSGYRPRKTAVQLIDRLLGQGNELRLRLPFAEDRQEEAKELFKSVFVFYRNYLAHEGKIDEVNEIHCFRIMALSSELLEFLDASEKSFSKVGGLDGLVRLGVFETKEIGLNLLTKLDCPGTLPDDDINNFVEDLHQFGFSLDQVDALIDIGLAKYESKEFVPDEFIEEMSFYQPQTIGGFIITELGNRVLEDPEIHLE